MIGAFSLPSRSKSRCLGINVIVWSVKYQMVFIYSYQIQMEPYFTQHDSKYSSLWVCSQLNRSATVQQLQQREGKKGIFGISATKAACAVDTHKRPPLILTVNDITCPSELEPYIKAKEKIQMWPFFSPHFFFLFPVWENLECFECWRGSNLFFGYTTVVAFLRRYTKRNGKSGLKGKQRTKTEGFMGNSRCFASTITSPCQKLPLGNKGL